MLENKKNYIHLKVENILASILQAVEESQSSRFRQKKVQMKNLPQCPTDMTSDIKDNKDSMLLVPHISKRPAYLWPISKLDVIIIDYSSQNKTTEFHFLNSSLKSTHLLVCI